MLKEHVDQIKELTNKAGNLVNELKAETEAEWEAVEKLTNAHKQLRSIETGKLLQVKMKM